MKSLILSLILLTTSSALAAPMTPACRHITPAQAEKAIKAVRMSPVLITCSNYPSATVDQDFTPLCKSGSYIINESAEPQLQGDMLIWFSTDAPDLNSMWVQTAPMKFETLGKLIGCKAWARSDATLRLVPAGK